MKAVIVALALGLATPSFADALRFESEPVPVTVRVTYGDVAISEVRECQTPCAIEIPPGAPFRAGVVQTSPDLALVSMTATAWKQGLFRRYLDPDVVRIVVAEPQQAAP